MQLNSTIKLGKQNFLIEDGHRDRVKSMSQLVHELPGHTHTCSGPILETLCTAIYYTLDEILISSKTLG